MDEKLLKKDYTFIVICLAIIAAGLFIGLKYFYQVFPEASIDFKVTRAQSKIVGQEFLTDRNLEVNGYKNASGFRFDDYAKVFLEKELGLEKAQEYFGDPVKLWYWEQRWFKPLQKEEFSVKITPEGEVIGFAHQIPEEQEGDSLNADSARTMALDFLCHIMGKDSSALEYVIGSQIARPKRLDHVFVYKVKEFEPAAESDYRYSVTVQGNEVSGYQEYLRVPEKWRQSYQELRSYNDTTATVAVLFILLTVIAVVAIVIARIKKRDIRWETAIWVGAIGFILVFLNDLNALPMDMLNYDTTASYSGFLIKNIGQSFLNAFLMGGVFLLLLTAGAETIYREWYGNFTSVSRLFSKVGWRTKSFFKSILLGITLTAFFFAYQIIFYMIANKLGGWAPADVPYSNLLNTAFPWITVLLIGFYPAVSEEFMSRMFSIPFLHKYSKSLLLALLVPAFVWGFAHANYPAQPFYIRGLEVGFAGVIIGVIMLRWGILPLLVWHYTVDAIYTALLLFRSGNWYFISTAVVATGLLVVPLLIALFLYWKTGRFLKPEGILNRDEVSMPLAEAEALKETHQAEKAPADVYYQPLSVKARWKGIILAVICIAIPFIPLERLGETAPDFKVTRSEAINIADEFLTTQGVDLKGIKHAEGIERALDKYAGKYFLEYGGVGEFNRLVRDDYPPNLWEIRRFKPGDRDEWNVYVHPSSGEVYSFDHNLPEEAVGDSISLDSAKVIAEVYLMQKGINLEGFNLNSSESNKRPNRVDHYFTYQAKEGNALNLEEAKYRLRLRVANSVVSNFGYYYKIPENWMRDRQSTTTLNAIFRVVKIAAISIFFGLAVIYLFLLTKKGMIPWKKAALIAIIPTVILATNGFNDFYKQVFSYQVMVPYEMFRIQMLIAIIISFIAIYLQWFLGSALLLGCYPKAAGDFNLQKRRAVRLDSAIAILIAIGFALLLSFVKEGLQSGLPQWIPFNSIPVAKAITAPLPFLDQFTSALQASLTYLIIIGFGIYLWNNLLRNPLLRILAVMLFLFALTPSMAKEPGEIFFAWITPILFLVLFVFLAMRYLRGNAMIYCSVIFAIMVWRRAVALFDSGSETAVYHGIIVVVLGLLTLWLGTLIKLTKNRNQLDN